MTTLRTRLLDLAGCNQHKRNCTVVALAATAGIPYGTAFVIAKQAGRQDNRGFRSETLIKYYSKLYGKNQFRKVKRSTITVQKFCKKYTEGKYFVRKRGHAFAIVDGLVVDKTKPKPLERIVEAWQYIGDNKNNETIIS